MLAWGGALGQMSARMTVYVVEDERALARHVVSALRRQGHEPSAFHEAAEAERAIMQGAPDLVVLDLNLPGFEGLELLARLRAARCPCRVLVLTARGGLEDRVAGLNAGADDYLPKPFAVEELVARVEALGRRAGVPEAGGKLKLEDLHLDAVKRWVTRAGQRVELTPREFELLHVLLAEPGRVFSRGELSERIWQRNHSYETRTVEIFVARLRKKIDLPGLKPLLHTVRSVGYVIQSDAPQE